MATKHYVYRLKTSDGEIIYIGKGSGTRMFKLVQIANGNSLAKKRNSKLYNKISSVIRIGGYVFPEVIFESENESDCLNMEIKLIREIGKQNLCNLTDGGEGTSGYLLSEETKRKISVARTGVKRMFSAQHRFHISQALKGHSCPWKGKTLSEETKRKMSVSGKGKNSGPISEKRRQAIIDGIRRKRNGAVFQR